MPTELVVILPGIWPRLVSFGAGTMGAAGAGGVTGAGGETKTAGAGGVTALSGAAVDLPVSLRKIESKILIITSFQVKGLFQTHVFRLGRCLVLVCWCLRFLTCYKASSDQPLRKDSQR